MAPSLKITCWRPGAGPQCPCPTFALSWKTHSSHCCKLGSLDLVSKEKKKDLLSFSLSISTAFIRGPTMRLSPLQAGCPV